MREEMQTIIIKTSQRDTNISNVICIIIFLYKIGYKALKNITLTSLSCLYSFFSVLVFFHFFSKTFQNVIVPFCWNNFPALWTLVLWTHRESNAFSAERVTTEKDYLISEDSPTNRTNQIFNVKSRSHGSFSSSCSARLTKSTRSPFHSLLEKVYSTPPLDMSLWASSGFISNFHCKILSCKEHNISSKFTVQRQTKVHRHTLLVKGSNCWLERHPLWEVGYWLWLIILLGYN